jgi:hypothetical protein
MCVSGGYLFVVVPPESRMCVLPVWGNIMILSLFNVVTATLQLLTMMEVVVAQRFFLF